MVKVYLFYAYILSNNSFCNIASVYFTRYTPSYKIGLSAIIALIVYFSFGIGEVVPQDLSYVILIVQEVLVGLAWFHCLSYYDRRPNGRRIY